MEVATKKFYSMMSQAVRQYMADEGVDDLRDTPLTDMSGNNFESAKQACEKFIQQYMKVTKICNKGCLNNTYKLISGVESLNVGTDKYWRGKFVLSNGMVLDIEA